jgi:iron complex outermembrane receptor protein
MKCIATVISILIALAAEAQDNKQKDTSKNIRDKVLNEVTVTAIKNHIETAPGKTIINVQATGITAGKNVIDLLKQSPGITVDIQGNISMSGKEGVLVMIDGKQTYITSGPELAEYLKGITADEVSQIELITQPSAQYDASGNAGIINIKTKKLRRQGFNGTATTSYEQNFYHYNTNTLLLNFRKNKTNWYTNFNYNNGTNAILWLQHSRYFDKAGNTLFTSDAVAKPIETYGRSNAKLGADYNYSDKITAGFFASGAYHTNTSHLVNTTNSASPTNGDAYISTRRTTDINIRQNAAANAYLKYAIGKQEELNVNVDYISNAKELLQDLSTETLANGVALPDPLLLDNYIAYLMKVFSIKADHNVTLRSGIKIESGAKYSSTLIDNDANYTKYAGNSWVYDSDRTNHFIYDENITALYVNSSKKLGEKLEGQLGLRTELANISGQQKASGDIFRRRLPAPFPTVYIAYKPDSSNTLELNYGRRVERPRYYSLNPFNYYSFWNTYERGNPYLLPQYSHNVELRHNYKNTLNTNLQLSYVTNVITSILVTDLSTQTAYGTSTNMASSKIASLTSSYNVRPISWWDITISVNAVYGSYSGVLSNIATTRDGYAYSGYVYNQFTAGKWNAELLVNYAGPNTQSLLTTMRPNIYSSLGVSRKVAHDSCTVRLDISDPLKINHLGWVDQQPGYYHTGDFRMNSRSCTIAITYNFGKNTIQKNRSYNVPRRSKKNVTACISVT